MKIQTANWGNIDYDTAMARMDEAHRQRVLGAIPDTLFVLEHPAVVTRGRKMQDVIFPGQATLEAAGVQVRNADRGGELTYHGPGQIVVYFVMTLKPHFAGIADLVLQIETVLLEFLKARDVRALIKKDHPGIWVNNKKIASLGLRVSDGVTKHGIALNIQNDLSVYQWFQPCGLTGDTMTNLVQLTGQMISDSEYQKMQKDLLSAFADHFQGAGKYLP